VSALHEWHEFYLLLGTAAAALVALLFVAISIGVGLFTERRAGATRTYLSPVVVHFTSTLFISAVALSPTHPPALVSTVFALTGLIGAMVALTTTINVFSDVKSVGVTTFDHFAYGLIPLFSYVGVFAAAILPAMKWEWAPELLAGTVLLLMLINIRNAWDLMLTVVRRQARRR
jgi:hypothetical protein